MGARGNNRMPGNSRGQSKQTERDRERERARERREGEKGRQKGKEQKKAAGTDRTGRGRGTREEGPCPHRLPTPQVAAGDAGSSRRPGRSRGAAVSQLKGPDEAPLDRPGEKVVPAAPAED